MTAWKSYQLRDICELNNGRAYGKDELLQDGKYPVLRVGNFFTNKNWYYSNLELNADKYCDTGDLLYAWSASFGPQLWHGGKVIYHYHIWKIIPDANLVDKFFLYYLLLNDVEKIKAASGTGATMMHVTKKSMDERQVLIPPLAVQQAIVAKLDAAFASIEQAIAAAERNADNAKQLFQSYLSDVFERGGEGWVEKKLTNVVKFQQGIQVDVGLQSSEKNENQTRFLRIVDFTQGNTEPRYIDNPGARFLVKADDISMVRYGSPGFVCTGLEGAIANNLFQIIPTDTNIFKKFLYWYLSAPIFQKQVRKAIGGAALQAISFKSMSDIHIRYPNLERQKFLIADFENLSQKTDVAYDAFVKKCELLNQLKQSLLQQAFNGQIVDA